jgi:peroxiredoxin
MNKIFLLLSAAAVFFSCNSKITKDGFSVEGTISNGAGKELVFSKLTTQSVIPLDTVKLDENGRFEFRGHTAIPNFYMLSISEKEFITLIVDSMQNVEVNANASKFSESYTVEGSKDSELLKHLNVRLTQSVNMIDSLGIIFRTQQNSKNDDSLRAALNPKIETEMNSLRKFSREFIDANPESMSLLIALSLSVSDRSPVFRLSEDMPIFEKVDKSLSAKYPNSEAVKSLHTYLEQMKGGQIVPSSPSIGQEAPEIELPAPDGKLVKLSSLRGNYVLLDFWASWCKPCRLENPNLVANFAKYKAKGFKIYQVSLDQTADAWKQAITADKLVWSHVSDLQFWNSVAAQRYGVQSIPANYLLDPTGKIIAVDLRGEQLGAELLKVYGF